jgi:hypothetical protein
VSVKQQTVFQKHLQVLKDICGGQTTGIPAEYKIIPEPATTPGWESNLSLFVRRRF